MWGTCEMKLSTDQKKVKFMGKISGDICNGINENDMLQCAFK